MIYKDNDLMAIKRKETQKQPVDPKLTTVATYPEIHKDINLMVFKITLESPARRQVFQVIIEVPLHTVL